MMKTACMRIVPWNISFYKTAPVCSGRDERRTTDFKRLSFKYPEYETYFTDDQKFILDHADQLLLPDSVVLPYDPLDRIQAADDCEEPFLMKAAERIKIQVITLI